MGTEMSSTSGAAEASSVPDDVRRQYTLRQSLVFSGIVIGYATYYFTRMSFTYVSPLIKADASLGIDMNALGTITSVFPLCYAFSKFAGGVLGDATNARYIHAAGLVITGSINIAFGFGSTLSWFTACWALNGLFQGFGAPPCAKVLSNWYPITTRGTWWGRWNASHNVGGFLIPLVAAGVGTAYGWRAGIMVPGAIGVLVGALVFFLIRDSPEEIGLPSAHAIAGLPEPHEKAAIKSADGKDESKSKAALREVLSRPQMWVLAGCYFLVYAIRQGVVNWSHFYLLEARGVATAAEAAARVSGLELGGLMGNLTAGPLSDWLLKRAKPGAGAVGKRNLVVFVFLLATAAMLGVLWQSPTTGFFASRLGHWLLLFAVGTFLYGPQLLVAMSAAEIVPKSAVATSQGFFGFISYLGAAMSGYPLAQIVQRQGGWDNFFMALMGLCLLASLFMLPMLGTKSYAQEVQEEQDAASKAA